MSRKRRKNRHKLFWFIVDLLILLLVCYLAIGSLNYYKISNNKAPIYEGKEFSYNKNGKSITVYDYIGYKIVKTTKNTKNNYNIIFWFMEE